MRGESFMLGFAVIVKLLFLALVIVVVVIGVVDLVDRLERPNGDRGLRLRKNFDGLRARSRMLFLLDLSSVSSTKLNIINYILIKRK